MWYAKVSHAPASKWCFNVLALFLVFISALIVRFYMWETDKFLLGAFCEKMHPLFLFLNFVYV